jgi:transposase-like protein
LTRSIEDMVTHVFHGPHGQHAEPVVRFGPHRAGPRRLWCHVCRKACTPPPRDRRITPETEERLAAAVTARLSQRAGARRLQVSRATSRRTLNKKRAAAGGAIRSSPPYAATRGRATRWWDASEYGGAPATSGAPARA